MILIFANLQFRPYIDQTFQPGKKFRLQGCPNLQDDSKRFRWDSVDVPRLRAVVRNFDETMVGFRSRKNENQYFDLCLWLEEELDLYTSRGQCFEDVPLIFGIVVHAQLELLARQEERNLSRLQSFLAHFQVELRLREV
jgi:hypothetical protein